MGRSGRRVGRTRNCLFLATTDESLIQAAGLIDLWAHGFVEPITAPPKPYHIIAQQLMALALQEKGIGRRDWAGWIENVVLLAGLTATDVEQLIEYMLKTQILSEDQGMFWLGSKGEETYGRRNFMELLSVFTSPPLFLVLHGRQELGFVDEITFLGKVGRPAHSIARREGVAGQPYRLAKTPCIRGINRCRRQIAMARRRPSARV